MRTAPRWPGCSCRKLHRPDCRTLHRYGSSCRSDRLRTLVSPRRTHPIQRPYTARRSVCPGCRQAWARSTGSCRCKRRLGNPGVRIRTHTRPPASPGEAIARWRASRGLVGALIARTALGSDISVDVNRQRRWRRGLIDRRAASPKVIIVRRTVRRDKIRPYHIR